MGRNVPDNEVVKKKIETVIANILVELSSSDIRHWLVDSQDYPYIISLQAPGGSSKTVRSIISLDSVGVQATVPDVMTYGFVALMIGVLVSMPVFMRKRRKT